MKLKPGLVIALGVLVVAGAIGFGWFTFNGEPWLAKSDTSPELVDPGPPIPPPDKPVSVRPLNPYPEAVRVELYAVDRDWVRKDRRIEREWLRPLTNDQRQAFETKITIESYEKPQAGTACCMPHHFLRYFDASGKKLGEVGICFCCSCITSDVGDPLGDNEYREFDYEGMKALISGLGIPTDIDCH